MNTNEEPRNSDCIRTRRPRDCETHRPRRIGRSIGAVLTGFLAVVILSLGTDVALHATGVFPPWGQPMADALLLLEEARANLKEAVALVLEANRALASEDGAGADLVREPLKVSG